MFCTGRLTPPVACDPCRAVQAPRGTARRRAVRHPAGAQDRLAAKVGGDHGVLLHCPSSPGAGRGRDGKRTNPCRPLQWMGGAAGAAPSALLTATQHPCPTTGPAPAAPAPYAAAEGSCQSAVRRARRGTRRLRGRPAEQPAERRQGAPRPAQRASVPVRAAGPSPEGHRTSCRRAVKSCEPTGHEARQRVPPRPDPPALAGAALDAGPRVRHAAGRRARRALDGTMSRCSTGPPRRRGRSTTNGRPA